MPLTLPSTQPNGPRPGLTTGRNRNTLINADSKQDASALMQPGRRASYGAPATSTPTKKAKKSGVQEDRSMRRLLQASQRPTPQAVPSPPTALNPLMIQMLQMTKAPKGGRGGQSGFTGSVTMSGNPGLKGGTPAQNIRLGKAMAAEMGWTGKQWRALKALWMRESSWRTDADNPTSSAYGIPQAMTSAHDVSRRYMNNNARAQINWGMNYLAERYGSPVEALQFHNRNNWY